jgi:hypothetical protein
MSAKKEEGSIEADRERAVGIDGIPWITECSISFRNADWGPRLLLSFRTGDHSQGDWIFPLFVANVEAHEDKLRLGVDTYDFWDLVTGEIQRILTKGGVVTTIHNLDSRGKNKRRAD